MIYADYNATTPLYPEVRAAMNEALDVSFGNPSSIHSAGQAARRLVDRARAQVAGLIGAAPDEIIFTSGGTEADNLAVLGVAGAALEGRKGIVTSAVEHKAVLDSCAFLQTKGHAVSVLPVDGDGRVDLAALEAAVKTDVALVSLMLANNDTGTIQPVAEAVRVAKTIPVHSDAVQAAGKLPIDVKTLGVSLLSFSSHKIHGPKGAGALFVRYGTRLAPLAHGGRQERTLRPGTENVPAIVGMGKAADLCRLVMNDESARITDLRNNLYNGIVNNIDEVNLNGSMEHRLANNLNFSFRYTKAENIILNMKDVAVSTGAACTSASLKPSHVLKSLGLLDEAIKSSIRMSPGRFTTEVEIEYVIKRIVQTVNKVRSYSPEYILNHKISLT